MGEQLGPGLGKIKTPTIHRHSPTARMRELPGLLQNVRRFRIEDPSIQPEEKAIKYVNFKNSDTGITHRFEVEHVKGETDDEILARVPEFGWSRYVLLDGAKPSYELTQAFSQPLTTAPTDDEKNRPTNIKDEGYNPERASGEKGRGAEILHFNPFTKEMWEPEKKDENGQVFQPGPAQVVSDQDVELLIMVTTADAKASAHNGKYPEFKRTYTFNGKEIDVLSEVFTTYDKITALNPVFSKEFADIMNYPRFIEPKKTGHVQKMPGSQTGVFTFQEYVRPERKIAPTFQIRRQMENNRHAAPWELELAGRLQKQGRLFGGFSPSLAGFAAALPAFAETQEGGGETELQLHLPIIRNFVQQEKGAQTDYGQTHASNAAKRHSGFSPLPPDSVLGELENSHLSLPGRTQIQGASSHEIAKNAPESLPSAQTSKSERPASIQPGQASNSSAFLIAPETMPPLLQSAFAPQDASYSVQPPHPQPSDQSALPSAPASMSVSASTASNHPLQPSHQTTNPALHANAEAFSILPQPHAQATNPAVRANAEAFSILPQPHAQATNPALQSNAAAILSSPQSHKHASNSTGMVRTTVSPDRAGPPSLSKSVPATQMAQAIRQEAGIPVSAKHLKPIIPKRGGIRGLILDLDGVLVNSEPLHYRVFQEVVAPFGIKMDRNHYYQNYIGRGAKYIFSDLLAKNGIGAPVEPLMEKHIQLVVARAGKGGLSPMPGAKNLVQLARANNVKAIIASGSPRKVVEVELKAIGLGHLPTVTSNDVTRKKPHPETFLKAAEKIGEKPSACLVIEDAPSGVLGALNARMPCLLVSKNASAGAKALASKDSKSLASKMLLAWLLGLFANEKKGKKPWQYSPPKPGARREKAENEKQRVIFPFPHAF